MCISEFHILFINEMVQAMYSYETRMFATYPALLNDEEMHDFYMSYCYYPR